MKIIVMILLILISIPIIIGLIAILFLKILDVIEKTDNYPHKAETKQRLIEGEKEQVAELILQFRNSTFLEEIIQIIAKYSKNSQLLDISINYYEIIISIFNGIEKNQIQTISKKISFLEMGYKNLTSLKELQAFSNALKQCLGNDFSLYCPDEESVRHDVDMYYDVNGLPQVGAHISYLYKGEMKPKLKSTH